MKKVLEFLNNLQQNNYREWFEDNKPVYKEAQAIFNDTVNKLIAGISSFDPSIAKLSAKDCTFRIYRDVRFSKDQTPYKTNFGVGYSRLKPMLRGGYYIHLEPGNSFVGGGFWGPDAKDLLRIRKEFEIGTAEIEKITSDNTFINYFKEIKGDAVKTAPRGFDKNHPSIDLIRKKQYVVMRPFTDKEVLSDDFHKEAVLTLLAMRPFFDYMSEVLTTDLNGQSLI